MNIKVRVLKRALRRLEKSGNDPYTGLCDSLYSSTRGKPYAEREASSQLRFEISNRIGGGYLQSWLLKNKHITEQEFTEIGQCRYPLRVKLKATRIAWLKALIKEHS